MGPFAIKPRLAIAVWIISVMIIGINLYIVGGFLVDAVDTSDKGAGWIYAATVLGAILYLAFISYLVRRDVASMGKKLGFSLVKGWDNDITDLGDPQQGAYSPLRSDAASNHVEQGVAESWEQSPERGRSKAAKNGSG